ncbi:helix-turn-helix transcriptional regulator [Streptomyces sp. 21So2-11]|uniref:helix-turn-helix domain-containing protein n=1 Tax=Streptomyces sp. 21So2-11 TaxID=3144408 RepID=UPI00321B6D35
MTSHVPNEARVVVPLRPATAAQEQAPAPKEPLWRDVVGSALRRERRAQGRTLKDVADEARISMPYLSELERGHKEASSEILAAAARALGLSLADLLDLGQAELIHLDCVTVARPATRLTSTRHRTGSGSRPSSHYGEVRMAA